MSSSLNHPFYFFVSSLIFLLLSFSGHVLSVAGPVPPNISKTAAYKTPASKAPASKSAAYKTAAYKAAVSKAAAYKPVTTKAAAASKPVASKPVLSKPVVSNAAAYKPVVSKPVASNAVASKAARRAMNIRRRNRQAMEFLNAHNIARVASGVPTLKWDQSLVTFASNWAKQRMSDCRMTHSGGPYGENIFWYQKIENWSPRNVVIKWVEESLNYNRFTNTCAFGKMCGHYTQVIWRTTTAVGCARTKCSNNRGFLVICEYSPSGNFEGETPFDY